MRRACKMEFATCKTQKGPAQTKPSGSSEPGAPSARLGLPATRSSVNALEMSRDLNSSSSAALSAILLAMALPQLASAQSEKPSRINRLWRSYDGRHRRLRKVGFARAQNL